LLTGHEFQVTGILRNCGNFYRSFERVSGLIL